MKIITIIFTSALGLSFIATGMERKTIWSAPRSTSYLLHDRFVCGNKQIRLVLPDGRIYVTRSASFHDVQAEDIVSVAADSLTGQAGKYKKALQKHIRRYGDINSPAPFFNLGDFRVYPEGGPSIIRATPLQAVAMVGDWDGIYGLLVAGADPKATTAEVPETPLQLLRAIANQQAYASEREELLVEIEEVWNANFEAAQAQRERRERRMERRDRQREVREANQANITKILSATLAVLVIVWLYQNHYLNFGSGSNA